MKKVIFFLLFWVLFSCEKKIEQKIELNRNIKIDLKSTINNKSSFSGYKFNDKIIKYQIRSEQLFDSNLNSFILNLNLTLTFKPSYNENSELSYDIYISDFNIKEKVLKGHLIFSSIFKKYETLFKAIFFNLVIDKYGNKIISIPDKISYNPNLKKMSGFIYNIVENIFFTFNKNSLNSESNIEKKYYSFEKSDIILKTNSMSINIKNSKKNTLVIGKNEKMEYYFLYSKEFALPIKINYLKKDSYRLNLNKKSLSYKVKNYYFIRKL